MGSSAPATMTTRTSRCEWLQTLPSNLSPAVTTIRVPWILRARRGAGVSGKGCSVCYGASRKAAAAALVPTSTCKCTANHCIVAAGAGSNAFGQFGDGDPLNSASNVPVGGPIGHTFTSLSAGVAHTCGLKPDGRALCFGKYRDLKLGAC